MDAVVIIKKIFVDNTYYHNIDGGHESQHWKLVYCAQLKEHSTTYHRQHYTEGEVLWKKIAETVKNAYTTIL